MFRGGGGRYFTSLLKGTINYSTNVSTFPATKPVTLFSNPDQVPFVLGPKTELQQNFV